MDRNAVAAALSGTVYGLGAKVRTKTDKTRTEMRGRVDGLGKVLVVVTEEDDKVGMRITVPKTDASLSAVYLSTDITDDTLDRFTRIVLAK